MAVSRVPADGSYEIAGRRTMSLVYSLLRA